MEKIYMPDKMKVGVSKELNIGRAGEYLVLADLLSHGIQAFDTGQGVSYDVIAEIESKLIRIQVKTTQTQKPIPGTKNPRYYFNVKKSGKKGAKKYGINDFDFYALVVLYEKKVFYLKNSESITNSLCIKIDGIKYGSGGRTSKDIKDIDLSINNLLLGKQ